MSFSPIKLETPVSPKPTSLMNHNEKDIHSADDSGIMNHSKPTTPRPEQAYLNKPTQPIRQVIRGRNNVFATETGPYFSSTRSFENLFASNKQDLLSPHIQGRMDRGFFFTDGDWTCYRRNYFQVSGVFSIHGLAQYTNGIYVKSNDVFHPVQRFFLNISAYVASSDREIELVQHTAKRDKGPQFKPSPKPVAHGGNLNISTSMSNNGSIAVFERIQFKIATANNGKRRAAQQYYVCYIDLYAETDRYELVKVASCPSAPLVVRGRSPGHYADSPKSRHHPYPPMNNNEQTYHQESYPKPPQQQQQQQEMMPYYYAPPYPPVYNHPNYEHPEAYPTPKVPPYMEYNDWQRARYNSASSGSSSVPSPQPHEQQPHYFAQQDQRSYSPTTPTYSSQYTKI